MRKLVAYYENILNQIESEGKVKSEERINRSQQYIDYENHHDR